MRRLRLLYIESEDSANSEHPVVYLRIQLNICKQTDVFRSRARAAGGKGCGFRPNITKR